MGLTWESDSDGHVPDNAISVGDGVYVARMRQSGDLIPGKVVPDNDKAYCCYGGREYEHTRYEVLCNEGSRRYDWVADSDGHVPDDAVEAGRSSQGDKIYIARSRINGEPVVGKVQDGLDCAYFPYGGEEHVKTNYEVLVTRD
ncbi:unnamed protein product [Calicophoron daubneyi]|uniref:DUF3421 domain-containing protein n=1 Tax=Calicophoron daubneyi TaxID=300641 RepID=A0AAV2TMJ4_CALDB